MPHNERLREALHELETLRQREAAALRESRALFAVLEALTRADTQQAALGALIAGARDYLGADCALVAAASPAHARIEAASPPHLVGRRLPPLGRLLDKPRSVGALAEAPAFAELETALAPALPGPLQAAVTAPLRLSEDRPGLLIALHPRRAQFSAADRQTLARIAALGEQALRALGLQAMNHLLAEVIDGASSGLAIGDARRPDCPLIFVNRAFEDLTGYRSDEVLGRNCRFMNAEAPDAEPRRRLRSIVARHGTGSVVLRNRRKDGTVFWCALSLYPVPGDDGTAQYLVATQTDVTEKVQAEQAGEQARRRMDDALSQTRDAVLLLSSSGAVRYANPAVARMLPAPHSGWRRGTGFRRNWAEYLDTLPGSPETFFDSLRDPDLDGLAALASGQELALPDGRVLLMRAQRTSDAGLVVTATDVTALKTAEHALRQRVAAIDEAPDGIGLADGENRVMNANPSLIALWDAPAEAALVGRDWRAVYAAHNPPAALATLEETMLRDGRAEAQLRRADGVGGVAIHGVSLSRAGDAGRILIVRDVTAQIAAQARRRELADQLEQARNQQTLSQLAAGLAHDFNNLLSAITGSATLIATEAGATEGQRLHADRILAAGRQAAELVHRFTVLGREQTDPGPFDLAQAVHAAADLFSAILADGTQLAVEAPEEGCMAWGDATEAGQIMLNLLINAQDALEGAQGRLTLALDPEPGAPETPVVEGALDPRRAYRRLAVSDTGSGIPAAALPRIFDPYFSTKADRGTGLGLATIARLVRRMGGAIGLATAPGAGTRFDIYWPTGPAAPATEIAAEPAADLPRLSGRLVLVVDDEPSVGEVVASYLERLGAEVAVVADPELAIEALRDDPQAWCAVITDYDMGSLSGGDVAAAAAAAAPDLPVFVVTALAHGISDPRIDRIARAVLPKPIDLPGLARAIARHTAPRQETAS